MRVDFASTKLAKACGSDKERVRAFGPDRARRLRVRLSALAAAETLEDLRNVPGRFHALAEDRAGQFTADLDHPYRLVFVPVLSAGEQDLHRDGWVWSKITHVRIEEITDTHE